MNAVPVVADALSTMPWVGPLFKTVAVVHERVQLYHENSEAALNLAKEVERALTVVTKASTERFRKLGDTAWLERSCVAESTLKPVTEEIEKAGALLVHYKATSMAMKAVLAGNMSARLVAIRKALADAMHNVMFDKVSIIHGTVLDIDKQQQDMAKELEHIRDAVHKVLDQARAGPNNQQHAQPQVVVGEQSRLLEVKDMVEAIMKDHQNKLELKLDAGLKQTKAQVAAGQKQIIAMLKGLQSPAPPVPPGPPVSHTMTTTATNTQQTATPAPPALPLPSARPPSPPAHSTAPGAQGQLFRSPLEAALADTAADGIFTQDDFSLIAAARLCLKPPRGFDTNSLAAQRVLQFMAKRLPGYASVAQLRAKATTVEEDLAKDTAYLEERAQDVSMQALRRYAQQVTTVTTEDGNTIKSRWLLQLARKPGPELLELSEQGKLPKLSAEQVNTMFIYFDANPVQLDARITAEDPGGRFIEGMQIRVKAWYKAVYGTTYTTGTGSIAVRCPCMAWVKADKTKCTSIADLRLRRCLRPASKLLKLHGCPEGSYFFVCHHHCVVSTDCLAPTFGGVID